MSIVAVRIVDDFVEFAADSISVRGYTQTKKSTKLAIVKSGVIIGGAGWAETTVLFQQWADTRTPSAPTEEAVGIYVGEFYDWYRDKTDKANRDIDENWYLIGFAGHAFYVNGYYVKEIDEFEAIGAGEDYALAAMYLGAMPDRAVETAIELSIYCEGPIRTLRMERPNQD